MYPDPDPECPKAYGSGFGSIIDPDPDSDPDLQHRQKQSSFAAVFCPHQQLRGVRGERRHQAGGERQRHQTGSPDTTGELLHYQVRAGVSEPYSLNPDTNPGMLVNMDPGPDPGFLINKNWKKKISVDLIWIHIHVNQMYPLLKKISKYCPKY
jgi:hypothetical protein